LISTQNMRCEMIIYRFIIFAVVSAVFAGRFIITISFLKFILDNAFLKCCHELFMIDV
jgi:hypothetical protein